MIVALCVDCRAEGVTTWRSARHPGPRCYTHWHIELRRRRMAAAGRRVENVYGITPEQYDTIKAVQGGRCAICQKATGESKRLAVDHDHTCCPGSTSCGRCVRGLLCGPCNDLLGHAHDDPAFFYRAIDYLRSWPSLQAGI